MKFWFIVAIITSEKTIRLNIAIVMPVRPGGAGVGDRGADGRQLAPEEAAELVDAGEEDVECSARSGWWRR